MKSFIHFSWLTNQIQFLFHDPLNVSHGSIIELSWYVSIMWCFIGNAWPPKVVQFNSCAMKNLFMVFLSDFHGIFTNLSFIVVAWCINKILRPNCSCFRGANCHHVPCYILMTPHSEKLKKWINDISSYTCFLLFTGFN